MHDDLQTEIKSIANELVCNSLDDIYQFSISLFFTISLSLSFDQLLDD